MKIPRVVLSLLASVCAVRMSASDYKSELNLIENCIMGILHEFSNGDTVTIPLIIKPNLEKSVLTSEFISKLMSKSNSLIIGNMYPSCEISLPDLRQQTYLLEIETETPMGTLSFNEGREVDTKFIIFLSASLPENTTDFLARLTETLSNQDILNFIVILPSEEKLSHLDIYTWFPYSSDSCSDRFSNHEMIGSYNSETSLTFWRQPFSEKFPLKYSNCKMRLWAEHQAPYVIVDGNENRTKLDGIEIRLLDQLSSWLQIRLEYLRNSSSFTWGKIYDNGTMTGSFLSLSKQEVDVLVGGYAATIGRFKYFDVSETQIVDSLNWVVPHAKIIDDWKLIIFALDSRVTMIVSCVFLIFSIIFWLVLSISQQNTIKFCYLPKSLQIGFFLCINEPIHSISGIVKLRVLLATLMIFSLIAQGIYNSSLTSSMTHPDHEPQIRKEEEIFANKLPVFLPENSDRYSELIEEVHNKASAGAYVFPNSTKCLEVISQTRNGVCLIRRCISEYLRKLYLDDNLIPKLFYFKDGTLIYTNHFIIRKRYFLRDQINLVLSRMVSTGIMSYLLNQFRSNIVYRKPGSIVLQPRLLRIDHLMTPFLIWTVGLALSCSVFLLELYTSKRMIGKT